MARFPHRPDSNQIYRDENNKEAGIATSLYLLFSLGCGTRTRTWDLMVMSHASCRCSTPRYISAQHSIRNRGNFVNRSVMEVLGQARRRRYMHQHELFSPATQPTPPYDPKGSGKSIPGLTCICRQSLHMKECPDY